ncbi:MAG: cupin domain-containing protein [Verrucomicrobiae bacterium]|nr:cupin domain-containing protein [Verrucomicrobiae bacterium]
MKALFPLFVLVALLASRSSGAEFNKAVTVTPKLKTTTSWEGKPIVYPTGEAEVTAMVIEIAPDGETGWHLHPVASFGLILEGDLEVSLLDGRKKVFKAGDAIAEVANTLHNGRNIGKSPVKLVVFYTGTKDGPLTRKQGE